MTRAVIYCRISRDPEGRQVGVDRQEADCRRLALQYGLTLTNVFIDNDIGASTLSKKKRPRYEEMMELAEAGQIRAILSYSNSRLTRRPLELERLIAAHDRTGVELRTVVSGRDDLSTADGRMVARIKASVDAAESERIGERVRRAKQDGRVDGKWGGGRRPYGYEPDGVTPRAGEAKVVVDVTDAVLTGSSLRALAADLNRRGLPTSTGTLWAPAELRKVLLRPRNAGLREHRGEIIGSAAWPALVDEEKWRAVQSMLTDPGRRTSFSTARRWMLSSSDDVVCGPCGSQLRVTLLTNTRRGVPSYTCKESKCVVRNAAELEAFVSAVVVERLSRPDAIDLLRPRTNTVDLGALHAEQSAIQRRIDDLADDIDLDERTLNRRVRALRARVDEINQRLTEAGRGSVLAGLVDAPDVAAAWEALHLDRRRAVVATLMTIVVHRTKKGRRRGWRPGQSYFEPNTIEITPKM